MLTSNAAPAMTILQLGCGRKKTLASIGFRMTAPDGTPYDDLSALTLVILDVLPALREASLHSKEPLFLDHCHFTPEGHRVVASVR